MADVQVMKLPDFQHCCIVNNESENDNDDDSDDGQDDGNVDDRKFKCSWFHVRAHLHFPVLTNYRGCLFCYCTYIVHHGMV